MSITFTALLFNEVSLSFATVNYWRGKLINWRLGLPELVMGVIHPPIGAPQFEIRTGHLINRLWRIGNYGY